MGDSGYRGVSAESDPRYRNKETKQIKQLASKGAFPANFDNKVDLRKVNLSVMKPWIEGKVNELLGFEDEVVAEYVFGILESDEMRPFPNPRKLQLSLTGFLESSTPTFTSELWTLLLSAQDSVGGIPKEFVEKKKEEMRLARQRDAEAIRAAGQSRPLPTEQRGGNARRSRWDDGAGAQAPSRQHFRDKSGNMTERSRDGGWGARGGGGPSRTYGGEIESSSASRAPQRDRYAERMQAGRDDGPARLEAARPRIAKPAAAAEEEEEQDHYRRRSRDRYEHRRSHRGDDSDAEGEQRKRERRDRSPQYGRESRDASTRRHRSRSPRYGRSSHSPPARGSSRQPQRGGRRYADGGSSSEEEQHRRGSGHRSRRRSPDYDGRESPRGASGSRVHAQGRSYLSRDESHEDYSSPERYAKSSKPSRREHDNGKGRAEGLTSSRSSERRSRSVSRSTRSYSSSESNA